MSWITPLGFLGLLGIAVLILIYLLKPNYQQKIVSSTYVWKLSLKYRRKSLPISRFRNILLLLCQLLIITACAFMLAQPFIRADVASAQREEIFILDSSADMHAAYNKETRYERAVALMRDRAEEIFGSGGVVSVIVAGKEASFLAERYGAESGETLLGELDGLVQDKTALACGYGTADIEGAVRLSERALAANPEAHVVLYTATSYFDEGNIEVVDVSARDASGKALEWNAAVLNVTATVEENFYTFAVDLACYGRNTDVMLFCDVYGANGQNDRISMRTPVRCEGDKTQTVYFNSETSGEFIYSYDYLIVSVDESDSFPYDDAFTLHGGKKEPLRIQYTSGVPNNFFYGQLMSMRDVLSTRWDIDLSEVRSNDTPELTGFDLYIFEHRLPVTMPTDGVIFLIDPVETEGSSVRLSDYGLELGDPVQGEFHPAAGETHPLTKYMTPENFLVTEYTRVLRSDGFTPLLYCGGDPVFLASNGENRMAVLSFSVNWSDLPVVIEFPTLLYNMLEYYLPSTLTQYVFDVDDTVQLNARGKDLAVSGPNINVKPQEVPFTLELPMYGPYTVTQTLRSGEDDYTVSQSFFVKIPAAESDLFAVEDMLARPYVEQAPDPEDYSLLIWVALAAVALLFLEWWLQSREYF